MADQEKQLPHGAEALGGLCPAPAGKPGPAARAPPGLLEGPKTPFSRSFKSTTRNLLALGKRMHVTYHARDGMNIGLGAGEIVATDLKKKPPGSSHFPSPG